MENYEPTFIEQGFFRSWVCRVLYFTILMSTIFVGSLEALSENSYNLDPGLRVSYIEKDAKDNPNHPLGSKKNPYKTLQQAEADQSNWDVLFGLPAPRNKGPLEGGITLLPGRKLLGLGPDPARANPNSARVWIANTDSGIQDGVALILTDNNEVAGLHFEDVKNSAILATNATNLAIRDNYFTKYNLDENTTLVRNEGIDEQSPVPAVFLLMTGNTVANEYLISDNLFIEANSGGIFLKQFDNSVSNIRIENNTLKKIGVLESDKPDLEHQYYGTQVYTFDNSESVQSYIGNLMDEIGFANSNSDALSMIIDEKSKQDITVKDHIYLNSTGVGGFASGGFATGMEVLAPADGEDGEIVVSIEDSIFDMTFDTVEGSAIQFNSLNNVPGSPGGTWNISIKNVMARSALWVVTAAVVGITDTVSMVVENSSLTGFAPEPSNFPFLNIGLDFFVGDFGFGPASVNTLDVTVKNVMIENHQSNGMDLFLDAGGTIGDVNIKVEDTTISDSLDYNIALFNFGGSITGNAIFDFGGGSLGSLGENRIFGGPVGDVIIDNIVGGSLDMKAENNWWGNNLGLLPSRQFVNGGTIDSVPFLTEDPE